MAEQYNYTEVIAWLENKGKIQFGEKFRIYTTDYPTIQMLLIYFLKDEYLAKQSKLDLTKGILLAGPIGCGKTTMMNLMKNISKTEKKFFVKPCREISFEFIKDGYEVIDKYSAAKFGEAEQRNICFDDLGTENNLKYFGNQCNVMAEVLLSRYDLFVSKKVLTHITTNLSATEIEAAYGNRVRSRMREMLNLITYATATPDKRL